MSTVVCNVLTKLRAKRKETQRDMANRLQISANYISLVEQGKRPLTEAVYKRIVDVYKPNDVFCALLRDELIVRPNLTRSELLSIVSGLNGNEVPKEVKEKLESYLQ